MSLDDRIDLAFQRDKKLANFKMGLQWQKAVSIKD
jgi:hypothetical protein